LLGRDAVALGAPLTDANHATPGPLPPPRRSHGCLWGCLIAAGIVLAVAIGGGFYVFHFLSTGVKGLTTVKAAIVQLDNDPAARALLGDNIEVTGSSSFNTSSDLATGSKESYVVHVKGTKGEGDYAIDADTPRGGALHFDKLTLSAGGQTLDVLHQGDNPSGGSI
jgi:Cytochrome oxidase complex assembly protein 1